MATAFSAVVAFGSEDEPVRLGNTEVVRQLAAHAGKQLGQPPPEELDGIALQRIPQLLLAGEHGPRRCAEGAVVEMGDAGVEQEVGTELLCRLHAASVARA